MARIRPYRAEDLDDLYRVCLETGDGGKDATELFVDPRLLGHIYAAPYGVLSPHTAFVIEDEGGVGGYVLGPPDSRAFEDACEKAWWPALRSAYSDPGDAPQSGWSREALMRFLIHHPQRTPSRIAGPYPAHLHIDLLPRLQGRGWGRRLLDRWLETVQGLGARGAHLGVSEANIRAIAFYRAYGLVEPKLERPPPPGVLWFARSF